MAVVAIGVFGSADVSGRRKLQAVQVGAVSGSAAHSWLYPYAGSTGTRRGVRCPLGR